MADAYQSFPPSELVAPCSSAAAVTPHDSTLLSYVTRAVYVGATGNMSVLMNDGSSATFVGIPAGTVLPIRVQRVNSTSTTASSIVALW